MWGCSLFAVLLKIYTQFIYNYCLFVSANVNNQLINKHIIIFSYTIRDFVKLRIIRFKKKKKYFKVI